MLKLNNSPHLTVMYCHVLFNRITIYKNRPALFKYRRPQACSPAYYTGVSLSFLHVPGQKRLLTPAKYFPH